ncbi:hypothetical protein Tco_1457143 [Tanacetum coccineum]
MSDSDESGVTYTEVSSPFEGLSDIGSPRADDHEYLELPGMPEDPYVEAALQAPPSPDYVPGPEEPEQAPPYSLRPRKLDGLFLDTYGWAYAFHQDKASSVRVPVENVTLFSSAHLLRENTDLFPVFATRVPIGPVFLLGLLVPTIVAACASRAQGTLSATRMNVSNKHLISIGSSWTGSLPSGRVDLMGDENPTDEDGDIEIGIQQSSHIFW